MRAYKLVRQMKDGSLSSLFIGKRNRLPVGKWLQAECLPTKGYAVRAGWHCTHKPQAPHLTMNGRAWVEVEIEEYEEFPRPEQQGGMWYIAQRMRILSGPESSSLP